MKLFGNTHGKNRRSRPTERPQNSSRPEAESQSRPAQDWENYPSQPREEQPRQRQAYPQQQAQRPARPASPSQTPRPAHPEERSASQAGRANPNGVRSQDTQTYRPRQQQEGQIRPYSKAAAKYAGYDDYEPYRTEADKRKIEAMIAAYQKKKLIRRLVLLGLLVVLIVVGVILWKSWVKPPETGNNDPLPSLTPTDPGDVDASPSPSTGGSPYRKDGVYTFLLVGNDDGNGNTDTILVGSFDTVNEKLNVVSIPRDTLVNVDWQVKKVNTVLAYTDMDGLKKELSKIMGFQVDSYGVVDLDAFVALVNAVDGVDFDVPVDMHYTDPVQDLYIDLNAGYQHLTGEQAVQVVRFRSYPNGDIGRVETQQAFLKALASKCLSLENLLKNASAYAEIFKEYVDTDLTLGNLIWYLQQFMKLDAEDINFYTMPGNGLESVLGLSYVSIYPDEWVDMINQYLNPLKEDVQVGQLSIMTRNANGDLYMTDGSEMYTNFYNNSGSSSTVQTQPPVQNSPEPSEDPVPSDEPEVSQTPDPGDTPEVDPDPGTSTEPAPTDSPENPADPETGGNGETPQA